MAKVKVYDCTWGDGGAMVSISCPGCAAAFPDHIRDGRHFLNVTTHHSWNGDVEKPTFQGSLLRNQSVGAPDGYVCHSYITDGMIQFLEDCTHPLKGQTVPLLDIE